MVAIRKDLSAARLRKLINYDPDTGRFTWRIKRKGRPYGWMPPGTEAGTIVNGYQRITVDGLAYPAARLAFLWMTGQWPRWEMDHKNRIRSDDRWCNIREATPSQNQANRVVFPNNALGLKGVCYEANRGKYKAYITIGGRTLNLGRYATLEEARAANHTICLWLMFLVPVLAIAIAVYLIFFP
jgi:hypothetical protein